MSVENMNSVCNVCNKTQSVNQSESSAVTKEFKGGKACHHGHSCDSISTSNNSKAVIRQAERIC